MFRKLVLYGTLACCSTLLSFTSPALAEEVSPIESIPQQTLLNYLAGKADFTLIDARSAEEYAAGHIYNAVSVPVDADLAMTEALPAQFDKPLVVYCKSGKRAQALQQRLIAQGYTDVKVLGPAQMLWADELPVFNCGATVTTSNELITTGSLASAGGEP